uniref:Putative branched-chain amino acid transport ATP-binding protein LivG n=1 Tax=Candidatus Methanophagaceae archaeon ANME-1 ERB6 TaxID=2759912 RepID=A0A7G9YUE9_9EURY|nr:putative branched-chain amino acid transport ATP-binding protein LivG [Methanosarcinales archaeon ANME-1 ERB6]
MGPNGAGKSTLLNVVSGVYLPTSGSIVFDGRDITNLSPNKVCKLGIAKTFQLVHSFPELSAFQNVLVGALFGNSGKISFVEARDKVEKNLEFVGYPLDKKNYPVKNLNVVELKRVQLARALATDPKLLLLDEVTTGLNPKESNDAISLIQKIRESGITILMVEHVMRVIMNVSDSIVVLHHGEKIAEGTPAEISKNENVINSYLGERTYM